METIERITQEIMADPANRSYTERGIPPLFSAPTTARINIVGQAPGVRAQETRLFWNDPSGDRLRAWMGVDRDTFYHSGMFAILPMDFYFPGKGKSGDLAPRRGFAEKWHPRILADLPHIQLTILVGQYATHHYLHLKSSVKLTDIVEDYRSYLPEFFPIVHPSPRNGIWLGAHPWFERDVVPALQQRVHEILK
ncbi:uracil-DNA glycosylase family protein [Bifidobacterium pseudolongum]|uniref:uracil-DNA glycosylase family protein n=1 Tax=Bifidobacterium pseudolongum TaxID=1694 RepID=UPI0010210135|nr:uracil-DNA glycosylase family protein [Bifidobacterium pseudolongum]RYQ43040.1 uracil-DNA glycosylase [Bifidobacterium pseudolongum subsp. globosum]HJE55357.1 uracil-DNA glycosylase family protein [Bifidobacterium pseudolongum subsp. globosum]